MLQLLKAATSQAHEALETELALLRPPLERKRFVEALQGFHAFHQVWEPRVAALLDAEGLFAPRRRLALIERDLASLGAAASPRTGAFDTDYLSSPSAAWGSLYVMEGSTLGGQVISKALRRTRWAPLGGLAYFNPYGERTGEMWRGFRQALEAAAPALHADVVVEAARLTFERLRHGLVPAIEAAA